MGCTVRNERGEPGGGQPSNAIYLQIYVQKAQATLAGAELELAHGLYNNAINRSYYATYQAAVAALVSDGVEPILDRYWPHEVVQTQFPALLIDERQHYAVE